MNRRYRPDTPSTRVQGLAFAIALGVALGVAFVVAVGTSRSVVAQAVVVDLAAGLEVGRFDDASRLAVGAGAIYVVDAGVNRVAQFDLRTNEVTVIGGGVNPDAAATPVDVDASTGLSFLVADQSGSVHRYSRDSALLETLRVLPERESELVSIASVDERTLYMVSRSGKLMRWTRDRGTQQIAFGRERMAQWQTPQRQTPQRHAPQSDQPVVQVVSNARNVFALADSGTCVHVLDAFGSAMGKILCNAGERISGLTVSGGALWLIKHQYDSAAANSDARLTIAESYTADGTLRSQVRIAGAHDHVVAAAVTENRLWVLTTRALYALDG